MEENDNDDYETPIEEWPGYLGHTWDQELFSGPELRELAQFDWDTYRELAPTDVREIALDLASGRNGLARRSPLAGSATAICAPGTMT
jgi:hypothetical protein